MAPELLTTAPELLTTAPRQWGELGGCSSPCRGAHGHTAGQAGHRGSSVPCLQACWGPGRAGLSSPWPW